MKKLTILSCVLILALFACTSKQDKENQEAEKIKAENIALVEKYIKAVQDKDSKVMADLLAEDYKGYGPSFNDSIDKAGAMASWKELSENLYEKIEYRKSVNIAAYVPDAYYPGHFVSNWADLHITYKDGRGSVEILANTSYRIDNGKITLSRTIYNEADAMRQLGYTHVPAE